MWMNWVFRRVYVMARIEIFGEKHGLLSDTCFWASRTERWLEVCFTPRDRETFVLVHRAFHLPNYFLLPVRTCVLTNSCSHNRGGNNWIQIVGFRVGLLLSIWHFRRRNGSKRRYAGESTLNAYMDTCILIFFDMFGTYIKGKYFLNRVVFYVYTII